MFKLFSSQWNIFFGPKSRTFCTSAAEKPQRNRLLQSVMLLKQTQKKDVQKQINPIIFYSNHIKTIFCQLSSFI